LPILARPSDRRARRQAGTAPLAHSDRAHRGSCARRPSRALRHSASYQRLFKLFWPQRAVTGSIAHCAKAAHSSWRTA